jgi:glycerol-1-phosphatase
VWRFGGWRATVSEGRLEVSGEGGVDDWWRAVASALWDHLDRSGSAADVTGLAAPEAGDGSDRGNLPA